MILEEVCSQGKYKVQRGHGEGSALVLLGMNRDGHSVKAPWGM